MVAEEHGQIRVEILFAVIVQDPDQPPLLWSWDCPDAVEALEAVLALRTDGLMVGPDRPLLIPTDADTATRIKIAGQMFSELQAWRISQDIHRPVEGADSRISLCMQSGRIIPETP